MNNHKNDRSAAVARAKRVLMIVTNPCTNDTRVIKEARALVSAGYEVCVVCRAAPDVPVEQVDGGVTYRRVEMAGRPWPSSNRFVRLLIRPALAIRAWLIFKNLSKRIRPVAISFAPHVVHAHDLVTLPAAVALGSELGAKVIYDAHELERHRNGAPAWRSWLAGILERRHIHRAHGVITVCESIAAWLAREYDIRKPTVVMNAPEASTPTKIASHDVRQAINVDATTPVCVYVGKLTFNRGLEQIIDALALWPALHLACLGPHHEPTVEKIRKQADQLGVAERFHILPSVPPNDVVSFVAAADFGVVPTQDACLSYRFSMPNKLFEMTFAGLPLAVSDLPEQRRFVERIGNGLVMNEKNPHDIAAVFQRVYAERETLRPNAEQRAIVTAEYAWPVQVARLHGLYATLVQAA